MKLRSGGLLFREKRSMGDFRRPEGGCQSNTACSWAPWASILGGIFDQKSIKNRCISWYIFWYDFWLMFDRFLVAFWIKKWPFFDNLSETVILWKIATRLYETIIFRGRRLQKSIKNRFENGIENNIDFRIDFWWILDRFWRLFGSKSGWPSLGRDSLASSPPT